MDTHSPQEDDPGFLECLYKDPDSNSSEQRYKRFHQWRPISWNPFDVNDGDEMTIDREENRHLLEKSPTSPNEDCLKIPTAPPMGKTERNQLLNPGPAWVNLFYDLAWTATFSSLTQNGQFDSAWETISYIAFFVVVWWLWASQVLYSINFYTDDWFHLFFIFLQMGIFGALAATTRGYDITTYILYSPGLEPRGLDSSPTPLNEILSPKRYNEEVTARTSIQVIAFSIAMSRVILLVQHLRVLAYAHLTVRNHQGQAYHIPRKLHIIPIGLVISTTMFSTAWGLTTSEFGTTVLGAKLKYVLWGSGLIVEVFSHVRMSRIGWPRPRFGRRDRWFWSSESKNEETLGYTALTESRSILSPVPRELPVPHSDVTLGSRLEAITTIILGEGINGIAGTLCSIISAPGLENPIFVNAICSGFIVYFLAYLYFEGPTSGHVDPTEKNRRKVYWLLLHLPFLLCIVLLLQGVKNQFLLTSFLSTARKIATELDSVDDNLLEIWTRPNLESDSSLIGQLRKYNISWPTEHANLVQNMTSGSLQGNASAPLTDKQKGILYIWHWRLSLNALLRIHQLFMGNTGVSQETQSRINDYMHNVTAPEHDHYASKSLGDLKYYEILEEVLEHSVQSARYIMVFAGLIFILLGALELAHSRPRDRFQCGAIISRFLIGIALILLLLLNVGGQQKLWVSKGREHEQAGVFRWISSYWVIPTLALAFGVECLVETASLAYCHLVNKANAHSRLSCGWRHSSGNAFMHVPAHLSPEWHGAH